jgi:putative methyltransferase (TIGR04325 family)
VYRTFADVPTHGAGHEGEHWVGSTRAYTHATMLAMAAGSAIEPLGEDHALLPLLVAATALQQRAIHVLDFGGGMGISFLHLRRAVSSAIRVRYTVIETEPVCAAARGLYAMDDRIAFVSELPASLEPVDIVYVRSALQYVEDYATLLRRLVSYGPRHVLLAALAAGDIPTFASAQINLEGSVIPYWFHGVDGIAAILAEEGYGLVVRTPSDYSFRHRMDVPRSHRLDRGVNLVFRRIAAT